MESFERKFLQMIKWIEYSNLTKRKEKPTTKYIELFFILNSGIECLIVFYKRIRIILRNFFPIISFVFISDINCKVWSKIRLLNTLKQRQSFKLAFSKPVDQIWSRILSMATKMYAGAISSQYQYQFYLNKSSNFNVFKI